VSRGRIVAAVAIVVVAVVLGLLGVAVLRTSGDLQARQRALAAGVALADPGSTASLPGRIGDALLGTAATRDYLRALALARTSGVDQPEGAVLQARGEAEALLAPIVSGGGNSLLRSRAGNLLGVLLFEDARAARTNPRRYLDQSLAAFQDAARLDPGYATAKANLELLQTLPPGTQFRQEGASGTHASSGGSGESGY